MSFYKIKLRPADKLFSKYIRARDKFTCQICGKFCGENNSLFKLECSHYYGRAKENTRFDPENCISLCFSCHAKYGHGEGREAYTDLMKKRLGERGFDLLTLRSNSKGTKDDELTKLYIKELMNEL